MFQPETMNDESCESFARQLFLTNLGTRPMDNVGLGDTLRASMSDLARYVIVELARQHEWVEDRGFVEYPYLMEALNAIAEATGGDTVEIPGEVEPQASALQLPEDSPAGYKLVRAMYEHRQNGFSIQQLISAIVVAEAEAGVNNSAETYQQILQAVGEGMVQYVEEQK